MLKLDFLTAGCNNEPGSLDQYNGRILFASGRNVFIAKIPTQPGEIPQIIAALPDAPKGRIHSCQWIKRDRRIIGALAVADDGSVKFYNNNNYNLNDDDDNNTTDTTDTTDTASDNITSYTSNHFTMHSSFTLPAAVTLASQTFNDNCFVTVATSKGEIYFFSVKISESNSSIDSVNLVGLIKSFAPKKITALTVSLLPNNPSTPFIMAALSDSTIKLLLPESVNADNWTWKEELSITGHQNWITSLSAKNLEMEKSVLILSSSLDKTIRVWKLFIDLPSNTDSKREESLLQELIPQKNHFSKDGINYRVIADSLALGHENSVFFANFIEDEHSSNYKRFDNTNDSGRDRNDTSKIISSNLQILSGSSDRSLILWSRASGEEAWRSTLQLGDLNGSLGTIGTDHTFTFYGGSLYCNQWILAAASTGSILFWYKSESDFGTTWTPQIPITGHTSIVESIAWSAHNFLVSCSKDQTTRIFYPSEGGVYREIARPQIHGYDLKCISLIQDPQTGCFELLSGADEKIVRVFAAPKQFYQKLGWENFGDNQAIPNAAELPALGLSNKTREEKDSTATSGTDTAEPLTIENEGELVRNSLWPEVDKLYGHNQEICTLSVSPDQKYMATAAKSHLVADAALRLWIRSKADESSCSKWIPRSIIPAHTLTVSKLIFSPDSQVLLSTSRDRHFCLIDPESGKVLLKQEAHSRMIYAADWVGHRAFLTGSRDKTVKFWKILIDDTQCMAALEQTITFECGITALAVYNDSLLAVGDEIGNIFFYQLTSSDPLNWIPMSVSVGGGGGIGPADSITDLKWNHINAVTPKLAVASADNSIRILSINNQ